MPNIYIRIDFGDMRVTNPHMEGCHIDIDTYRNRLVTVGTDDIVFIDEGKDSQQIQIQGLLSNDEQISCMALCPEEAICYALGTTKGNVWLVKDNNFHQADLLYHGSFNVIQQVHFRDTNHLIVANTSSQLIVIDLNTRKFNQTSNSYAILAHTIYSFMQYLIILTVDGTITCYQLQIQSAATKSLASYKVITQDVVKLNSYFTISAKYDGQIVLAVSGSTTLQTITINSNNCQYGLHMPIHHTENILHCCWLHNEVLGTATQTQMIIWQFKTGYKLYSINLDCTPFKLCSIDRNIHHKSQFLSVIICNRKSYLLEFIGMKQVQIKFKEYINVQVAQKIKEVYKEKVHISPPRKTNALKKIEESKAAMLLQQYPQMCLIKSFEQYRGCRFLYYNHIGCIIERMQKEEMPIISLQFHDRSRLSRIKMNSDKSYCYFALSSDSLIYGSHSQIVFQNQKQLRQNYQWELEWQSVEGVCIGSGWVAIANTDDIKIFDYGGNELHTIALGRKYVAMEAYQDHLAVIMHCEVPIWGCQNLLLKVWKIAGSYFNLIKTTKVPVTATSLLKWVGFSEQGQLFIQDSSQCLKCYNFYNDEWNVVLSLKGSQQRLFIQHIDNYQIYGFRLQRKKDDHDEPKVLPRSLPRRIKLEIPAIQGLKDDKDSKTYINQLKIRRIALEHQYYRYENWFKYKYSRKKDHLSYQNCKNIMSIEQIRNQKTQHDLQLYRLVSKYAQTHVNKNKEQIFSLCNNLAYFPETIQKVKEILDSSCEYYIRLHQYTPHTYNKINQIDKLEQIIDVCKVLSNHQNPQ